MPDFAIKVENLSKCYRIGLKEQKSETLAGAMLDWFKAPFSNLKHLRRLTRFDGEPGAKDLIWALADVSLTIAPGEVVGVIGRNGAGKSTLLKIISRITEPTSGRVLLNGSVSSLLEVGTGFHPDLTGRENVYLNGTILGMTKAEINRKFDAIVDFAEVEKFLDTPVKRYSSGMKVRLAFAVAAHLEPEILLVDEVLAVGDASFQKKCLGKMGEVSKEGRTVMFVSHNMGAVNSLCEKVALFDSGKLEKIGPSKDIISYYKSKLAETTPSQNTEPGLFEVKKNQRDKEATIEAIEIINPESGQRKHEIISGESVAFRLHYYSQINLHDASFMFGVCTDDNTVLIKYNSQRNDGVETPIRKGRSYIDCIFMEFPLTAGEYYIMAGIAHTMVKWFFISNEFGRISVSHSYDSHGQSFITSDIAYIHARHAWRMQDW